MPKSMASAALITPTPFVRAMKISFWVSRPSKSAMPWRTAVRTSRTRATKFVGTSQAMPPGRR